MARQVFHVFVFCSYAATAFAADRVPSRMDVKPTVLAIAMAADCRTTNKTTGIAKQEAARVWSRADVSLRWVAASELPFGSPDWLVVRCAAEQMPVNSPEPIEVMPIAAIRFVDSRPTNTITLSLRNANTLLQRDADRSRDDHGALIPFKEIRLGRLLGRAIAHEVGHFLSRSGAHTSSGLMRRTHTVAALTGASIGPFSVDLDDERVPRMPKS